MNSNPSPLIAISVGEASGDLLGAHLIRAIKARCPNARFTGIGGERMKAEGFESLYDQEKLAVRGFVEVIKRLPQILRIRKGLVNDLIRLKPDVFIGIDAPDFNLGVAEKLKQAGIHTIHYVSPSVWAWRRERVNKIVHQVDRVLYDLKHNPASRRILTSLYNFADLHEMALYPCAYSMTFHVSGNRLDAILNQRSQDMLTANNWNVVQYAVLVHMLAQVSGLVAGELVHVIADCHIYDRHIPLVEQMLELEPYPAPEFRLDPAVTDFYAFTPDSVQVENYRYHPFSARIPVAI